MTLDEAKTILGDEIKPDGGITGSWDYIAYDKGDKTACLDGHFNADTLEAIAVYMRSTQK